MCGGYGPNERDDEKRYRFWNDMERTLGNIWNGYRLCIPGDLSRWIGDRTRAGVTGVSEVPGENDKGKRVGEICSERVLCLDNIF